MTGMNFFKHVLLMFGLGASGHLGSIARGS